MAINKQYLNISFSDVDSLSRLQSYLSASLVTDLGIAESVAINQTNSNILDIVCDGLTVSLNNSNGVIETITGTCEGDSSYTSITYPSSGYGNAMQRALYLYTTTTSAVLLLSNGGDNPSHQSPILFTKTNNGKAAVVVVKDPQDVGSTSQAFPVNGYYVFSGDDYTIQTTAKTTKGDTSQGASNQVQLAPFITNPNIGVTSYTPSANKAIISKVKCSNYGDWQTYILGDHKYLTNGGWWLKDDPV